MKLQASHHGRDGRHQAPPAVQTWSYRLDKAASYDSNLGNAELVLHSRGLSEKPRAQARRAKRGRTVKNRIVTNDYVDAALCVLFVLVVVSMVVFSVRPPS